MSGVVPIVFRAAGHVPGMSAGVGLAAVTSTGYLGFLVGPPIDRRPGRDRRACPARSCVIVVLALAVALLAPTTRYARGGSAVVREPQTVAA